MRRAAEAFITGTTDKEEVRGDVEDLHDALLDRLLHDQEVLRREGADLPYRRAIEAGLRLVDEKERLT